MLVVGGLSEHEFLAELVEAGPAAEQDDAVAGFERRVAAGRELDATIGAFDGDHHDAGEAAHVGVTERLAGQRAAGFDRNVIYLDGQARSLGHEFDEFDRRGIGEQRDNAVGADHSRHDHVVGPRLSQLLLTGGLLGPGDDQKIGGELAGRERDEDVRGIIAQR